MKTYMILLCVILISVNNTYGQEKVVDSSNDTMIDKYFSGYSKQPGFEVKQMSEAMINRSNETGMWKHPAIARIMKQIRFYKYLDMPASQEFVTKVLDQVNQKVKKDHVYDEYFRWEQNGNTSVIIYTRGKKAITELVTVSIQWGNMHVSSFVGDAIDIESVKALTTNP
ncbi:MAG: hypothetical protein JWR38_2274 [Mucilaginibacter sp.]|nr:hypothetical protein [Mucilaginibacter sp.]